MTDAIENEQQSPSETPSEVPADDTHAPFRKPPKGGVRTGDGTWPHQRPRTEEEAIVALSEAARYCSTKCPIYDRCVGDDCAIHRGEQAAKAILREDVEIAAGVPLVETIAR